MTAREIVKEARAAAGLSQAQLARRLGISQPEIARLESPRSNPRLGTLLKAVAATGHRLEASLRPAPTNVDETMIAANLRLAPAERLDRFAQAYAGISGLVAATRRGP